MDDIFLYIFTRLSKKFALIITFFILTPLTLAVSMFSLFSIHGQVKEPVLFSNVIEIPKKGAQIYASLPSDYPSVSVKIHAADARPELIDLYLKSNNSPLAGYGKLLVETADKYELDYRLLTAIAQKESGLCRVIPENSYNCWGWGIHSAGTLKFSSFDEAIEIVSKGLKEKYIDLGYITVEDIMKKYAHPSSTTWAEGVLLYMSQIQ